MEYSGIASDSPGPLERYEAATRQTREILIHRVAGVEPSNLEVNVRSGSIQPVPTIVLPDFSNDSERMKEEESQAPIGPVWLQALLLTVVMGAATFLLVLIAISINGIARHFF